MLSYILATFFDVKKVERKDNKVLTFVGKNRESLKLTDRRNNPIRISGGVLSEYFDKVVGLNSKERLYYTKNISD